jgi:hypothetical protein
MTVVPQDRNEITSWLQQPNVPRPIIGAIQDDVLKKRYGIESFITRDLHSFIVLSRMAKLICQDLTPYLYLFAYSAQFAGNLPHEFSAYNP